jgi:hypothetical protein
VIVEQIWTGNAYRNFNYLIVCPETGDALAIDPLDHEKCLARAKDKGWDIWSPRPAPSCWPTPTPATRSPASTGASTPAT